MQGFRRTRAVVIVFAAVSVAAGAANAAILEIQFSGVDLTYDGTNVFDTTAGTANTARSGARADADPLETMVFLIDGVQQGPVITTDIRFDTFIQDLSGVPATGGSVATAGNGDAFGVDLLTKGTDPAWGLALNIDQFQFFYSGNKVSIATAGPSTSLVTQDLPFGLQFDPSQPISIVFSSANLRDVTTDNGFLTGLKAAGTGNITGTLLPEPASLALMVLGGAMASRRTRSRH